MPLALRYRLDVCGLKLSLASWQSLPFSERVLLLSLSFENEDERIIWKAHLKKLVTDFGLQEPMVLAAWLDPQEIPNDVAEKLVLFGFQMDVEEWSRFKPMQRYALCKLARGKQAERYLFRAVLEFRALCHK